MVLDFRKVRRTEVVTGLAGVALIVIMLAFHWYAVRESHLIGSQGTRTGLAQNAFEAYGITDLILLATALAAIALPITKAAGWRPASSAWPATIVLGLAIVSVLLVVIRIAAPPDLEASSGAHASDFPHVDVVLRGGVWVGLAAVVAILGGAFGAGREEARPVGANTSLGRPAGAE